MDNVQKITVEKIYDNRKDPKSPNKLLQLRVERAKAATNAGSILNQFLVGGTPNVEKLVGFQTMHTDKIAEFGIEEGCNLNEKLEQPVKLVVSEITESEYNALESNAQIPYGRNPKINPSTDEALVDANGEVIYRGILLTAQADPMTDSYISHVGSQAYSQKESTIDEAVADDLAS